MYEKIYEMENLKESFKKVKRNRGSAGVDGITLSDYKENLENNLEVLQAKLKLGSYRPKPVKRVYIDKPDGKKRPLGIPTVEDRIVQQAIRLVIEPRFERKFLECSYGFRPNKSAHMAVDEIKKVLQSGYRYVIDADLKSYFDTIDQELLMKEVQKEIEAPEVLDLIRKTLKSGVLEYGCFHETEKGTTQGGVLSPLLANIYLHAFDELMAQRGHKMVRYADDFIVFHKSQKGAERVLQGIVKFLEGTYRLQVHPEKTKIVDSYTESFVFLGFEFTPWGTIRVPEKKVKAFKAKVKKITRRNQTVNIGNLIKERLNPVLRGWANYYAIANIKTLLTNAMSWIRRRLRMVQMRSWRKPKKMYKAMRRNGWRGRIIPLAMSRWHNSLSKQAHMAMPNEWFDSLGLVDLVKIYDDYHPQRG